MKKIVIIVLLSIILFILVSRRSSGMEAQAETRSKSENLAKGEVRGKVASSPKVTLFSDCNFRGKMVDVSFGEYASMEKAGFVNDILSSMKIPAGFKVQIFSDVNFRGANATFNNDIDCLMKVKIPGFGRMTMNDRVSSLKISKA